MSKPARLELPGGRTQVHLTGFMGSGKSTVGRLLARRLTWNFLDLDGVVERHEGRRVADIFAGGGEAAFRAAERQVLRQVVGKKATIVALGGGTLIDLANRELSRHHAVLVWLRCPLEVLEWRCAGVTTVRPLWGDFEVLQQRYGERLPGYESADLVIEAENEPGAVAAAVYEALTERSSPIGRGPALPGEA